MLNPSEINLSSLPWLPLDAKSAFPKNPAIYFAIDSQGTVQYIGRSINPKSRWANHHKYKHLEAIGSIKIVYLFVDSPNLLPEIESALILWFDPPLNVADKSTNSLNRLCDPLATKQIPMICKLPQLMEAKGINQKDLAAATGLSPTTVSKFYRNQLDRFDRNTVLKLCEFFECKSISDLIEIEN